MTIVLDDLPYLRKLLGEAWIQAEVFSEKPKHLLGRWQKKRPEDPWVVTYAEELVRGILTSTKIKFDPEALARKLKSPTDFVPTLAELETALFLAEQGFNVTMEPMAPEKGPDLQADWEGTPYFVEIRTVGLSEDEDRRDSVTEEIFRKLRTVPSNYQVILTVNQGYKAGSTELREAIKAIIQCLNEMKKLGANRGTLYYAEKDKAVLTLPNAAIGPQGREIIKKATLVAQIDPRGHESPGTPASVKEPLKEHPPEQVKDHERLKNILQSKRGQLPKGARGILVLEVSKLFMLSDFSVERALYGDLTVAFPPVNSPGEPVGEMKEWRSTRGFLLHTSRVSAVVIQKRSVEQGKVTNKWRVFPTNRADDDTIRLTLPELRRFGDLEDRRIFLP
jgi:hypothetical protein